MGVFVRRVKTASGATAVQIVHKRGRRVLSIEHIGSAHTDDELAMLLQIAGERHHAGQLALDLGDAGADGAGTPAVVEGTASLILWEVLASIYDDLGLDRLGDGEGSQAPPTSALSHCHHRRPAGERPAPHPRRGPNPPQRPRLEWSLNRYNSGRARG